MSLRLGSSPTTGTGSDEGEPIAFGDSCPCCGSRKRKCLGPCFKSRKKLFSTSSSPQDAQKSPSLIRNLSEPFFATSPASRIASLCRTMSDPTTSTVKNYNPFTSPSPQPSSQRSFVPSNSFSSPKPNAPDVHVAAASFPQEPPAAGQCARVGSFLGSSSDIPKASPPPAQASSFLPARQPVSTTPVPFQVPTTEPIKRNALFVSVCSSPATDTTAKTEPSVRVEEKAPETFEIPMVIRIKEEENLNKDVVSKEEDNEKQRKGAAFTLGLKCACGRFYEISCLP